MFWTLQLLILAQAFFMAKEIENIPFFLYHMYSRAHPQKDSTAVYLIKTADGYFNHKKLSNREEEMLMNSVSYYMKLKRDGDGINESIKKRFEGIVPSSAFEYLEKQLSNDSTSLANFPSWWARYFRSLSNNRYDSADVVRSYIYSQPPYRKSATDSLVFSITLK